MVEAAQGVRGEAAHLVLHAQVAVAEHRGHGLQRRLFAQAAVGQGHDAFPVIREYLPELADIVRQAAADKPGKPQLLRFTDNGVLHMQHGFGPLRLFPGLLQLALRLSFARLLETAFLCYRAKVAPGLLHAMLLLLVINAATLIKTIATINEP